MTQYSTEDLDRCILTIIPATRFNVSVNNNDHKLTAALDRCQTNGWITLMDVRHIPELEGLHRVFHLTASGISRRNELLKTQTPKPVNVKLN